MPLVNPHGGGGGLRPLLLQGEALAAEKRRAATLPRVRVTSREKGDIIMLGIGGFTPLEGFMTRADWEGVCDGMKTAGGLFWPIPITLSTDKSTAATFGTGADVALVDPDNGEILASMRITEKYEIDKAHECAFEQEHMVAERVLRHGAGKRVRFSETTPSSLADMILAYVGKEADWPVFLGTRFESRWSSQPRRQDR